MDEVLSAFLGECYENLEQLDHELVLLEQEPESPDTQSNLAKIFRTVHTIKGSCGWLGLTKLESVVHDGEDLLVCLRDGQLSITSPIVSALLEMFDAIREILKTIETTEQEGDADYSLLIGKLKALQTPGASIQEQSTSLLQESPREPIPKSESANTPPVKSVPISSVDRTPEKQVQEQIPVKTGASRNMVQNIRVDVAVLDKLMNLVGELVLTRNQMLQLVETKADAAFVSSAQRLNLITTELQEGVMKTRMQVIGTVWKKYPRLVRDLAIECGKHVSLGMLGQETELDRNIIEAIQDPLTHIVRNAVDHGLESPKQRVRLGKPPEGNVTLKAYHEGGHVNISISDDGQGIDPEKIRSKAIQKSLLTPTEADNLSQRELLSLIFLPGFSTAESVTHISGRGVGMDVVKTNIEEVGGTVELFSELGHGSTFKIKIPLTLAIIPALLIRCLSEQFALPQMNLIELLSLEMSAAHEKIELIYNTPVYRLRGKLLPLLCLRKELGLANSVLDSIANEKSLDSEDFINIIVLQADEQQFGLIVDHISDTEEIVVKPLSKQLKKMSVYSGATILGNGQVALILDIMGLAQRAKVTPDVRHNRLQLEQSSLNEKDKKEGDQLLLFYIGNQRKMGIPISLVSRLEEFVFKDIETSGALPVIQYHQQILPLVFLQEFFCGDKPKYVDDDLLNVIVCGKENHLVGLVIHQIIDVVEPEEGLSIQSSLKREGILGSAILQEEVVDILDIQKIVTHYIPSFFDAFSSHEYTLVGVTS